MKLITGADEERQNWKSSVQIRSVLGRKKRPDFHLATQQNGDVQSRFSLQDDYSIKLDHFAYRT